MCNRVRRGSWDNKKPAKSGHEINMAAGSEEIAESLNKCVKNLATAAEALFRLHNRRYFICHTKSYNAFKFSTAACCDANLVLRIHILINMYD